MDDTKIFVRRINKWMRRRMCICTSALAGSLPCSSRQKDSERRRNAGQLTYAETSAKLVNKPTHGHSATLAQRSHEQLLPLKASPSQTAGQFAPQTGCHCDPSLHGGRYTTGHYWHIPAAEVHHHSCSVGEGGWGKGWEGGRDESRPGAVEV